MCRVTRRGHFPAPQPILSFVPPLLPLPPQGFCPDPHKDASDPRSLNVMGAPPHSCYHPPWVAGRPTLLKPSLPLALGGPSASLGPSQTLVAGWALAFGLPSQRRVSLDTQPFSSRYAPLDHPPPTFKTPPVCLWLSEPICCPGPSSHPRPTFLMDPSTTKHPRITHPAPATQHP